MDIRVILVSLPITFLFACSTPKINQTETYRLISSEKSTNQKDMLAGFNIFQNEQNEELPLIEQAALNCKTNKITAGMQLLQKLILSTPKDFAVNSILALCSAYDKKFNEAILLLDRSKKLASSSKLRNVIEDNIVLIKDLSGQFEIETLYIEELKKRPHSFALNYNFGIHLLSNRNFAKSIIFFQNAMRIEPSNDFAKLAYAMSISHSDLDEANRFFKTSLELKENNPIKIFYSIIFYNEYLRDKKKLETLLFRIKKEEFFTKLPNKFKEYINSI